MGIFFVSIIIIKRLERHFFPCLCTLYKKSCCCNPLFELMFLMFSVNKSSAPWVRYFVADNVLEEVTFGWPRQRGSFQLKEHLALGLEQAINWVPVLL